jgi:hypothetical protein
MTAAFCLPVAVGAAATVSNSRIREFETVAICPAYQENENRVKRRVRSQFPIRREIHFNQVGDEVTSL